MFLTLLGASKAESEDRYAFLVGVKQSGMTQLTSLPYPDAEVTALALAQHEPESAESNVVLMTQAQGASNFRQLPGSQQIRKAMDLLPGERKADDTLVFSAHGVQFRNGTNVFVCPIDARLQDRSALISLTDMYATLSDPKKCNAQTKTLLMDVCRNDPQTRLSKTGREIKLEPIGVAQQSDGVAAFFSCSHGQKSYEHPGLGHGIFDDFVNEGFGG